MQYPTSQNPKKATVTVTGRTPRSADELPTEIDGKKVIVRPAHEPTIQAFHRSELAALKPEEYAMLKPAIDEALEHGLIIDDLSDPRVLAEQEAAHRKSADVMLAAIRKRDTRQAANGAYKAYEAAKLEFDRQSKIDPASAASFAAEREMNELGQTWEGLEQEAKAAAAPTA